MEYFNYYLLNSHKTSEKEFVINDGKNLSFKSLWSQIKKNASILQSRLPGKQLIGLLAQNSPYFIVHYLSIISSGHVAVLLDARLKSNEHKINIENNNVNVILSQPKFASKLQEILGHDSNIKVISDCADLSKNIVSIPEIDFPSDVAIIIFTSGSTGNRKGVMLTHKNLIANTNSIIKYLSLSAKDRMNVVLPFTYTYGLSLLHTHLKVGGSIYLHSSSFLGTVIAEIKEFNCTGLAGVPLTFQVLLSRTSFLKEKFPSLRYMTQAGGKLADKYIQKISNDRPDIDFFVMYGATEATSRMTYLPPKKLSKHIGSIGKAIPGVTIEILNDYDLPVKIGEIGEIVASGENIMAGYLNNPVDTKIALKNGKFYTGDLARMDRDGFIFLVGRKSRFVKSMGYKVGLDAIEQTLLKMNNVVNAVAFGVEDSLIGEVVAALVEADHRADLEQLKKALFDQCNQVLASYEIPHEIKFVKCIPLNSSGKIDTTKLEEVLNSDQCL